MAFQTARGHQGYSHKWWPLLLRNMTIRWTQNSLSQIVNFSCGSNGTFRTIYRIDSRLAPSQWETSLRSNAVSHWLGANLESALNLTQCHSRWCLGSLCRQALNNHAIDCVGQGCVCRGIIFQLAVQCPYRELVENPSRYLCFSRIIKRVKGWDDDAQDGGCHFKQNWGTVKTAIGSIIAPSLSGLVVRHCKQQTRNAGYHWYQQPVIVSQQRKLLVSHVMLRKIAKPVANFELQSLISPCFILPSANTPSTHDT